MNTKYEITDIAHEKYPFLHRIRALRDVGAEVKAGDLGGAVIISGEEVCNNSPDTIVLDGKSRTVLREPFREELAPHQQQEKQKKPRNRGRDR